MTKEGQNEEEELKQLWNLFQDSPEDIQLRRQQITRAIQQDKVSEFPTSISIVTALDELFGCFAVGAQVKNFYRYGTYETCQRQRQKFWFAIKNGSMYENDKPLSEMTPKQIIQAEKIQEFYKKRLLEDKAKGSSEDIWDVRKNKLANPFKK